MLSHTKHPKKRSTLPNRRVAASISPALHGLIMVPYENPQKRGSGGCFQASAGMMQPGLCDSHTRGAEALHNPLYLSWCTLHIQFNSFPGRTAIPAPCRSLNKNVRHQQRPGLIASNAHLRKFRLFVVNTHVLLIHEGCSWGGNDDHH